MNEKIHALIVAIGGFVDAKESGRAGYGIAYDKLASALEPLFSARDDSLAQKIVEYHHAVCDALRLGTHHPREIVLKAIRRDLQFFCDVCDLLKAEECDRGIILGALRRRLAPTTDERMTHAAMCRALRLHESSTWQAMIRQAAQDVADLDDAKERILALQSLSK